VCGERKLEYFCSGGLRDSANDTQTINIAADLGFLLFPSNPKIVTGAL
jgi:hypothetical protein